MNRIEAVHAAGQSFWLDDLRREMIESGELRERIEAGELRGMTSNPTIFEQAIARGEAYSDALRPLAQAGWSAERIVDHLMLEDVRAAADLFRPVYEASQGADGFVSLEVHPQLADDTEATLVETRRLWTALNRPNVMIKIPATASGIPAIRRAIAEGINVNITLIFSLTRYAEVIEAYLLGLEERVGRGAAVDHVASVASFFVSRVDTAVDARLEKIIRDEGPEAGRAAELLGQAAIANAKLAYAQFQAAFSDERFARLRERGARVQRPLWASTSTKNPAYPDTYYVDSLIGPETVNTLPLPTLEAFRDHGRAEPTLTEGLSGARSRLEALRTIGISMDEVTFELERQGVRKFDESFRSLVRTVEQRATAARREVQALLPRLQATLEALDGEDVARRLWSRDGSLWPGQPSEWLGWLDLPEAAVGHLATIEAFLRDASQAGFRRALILGMGGSSLAARVLAGAGPGRPLSVDVLDTIEPGAVLAASRSVEATLFVVASKSGTTIEPLSLLEHFWSRERQVNRGSGFVAITDPGTPLEALAKERGFRSIFPAPPDVGGRFSALSVFGLVPAALAGADPRAALDGAARMARRCGPNVEAARNPGLFLAALLASAAAEGRDKVTFVADPALEALPAWIEQLLAESSGKDGRGLFPVVGEPPAPASRYASDRVIVYLRVDGSLDAHVERWVRAAVPVVVLPGGQGPARLGAEFFRWEVATAIVCHLLGVNAFDQPDVQRAKDAAREALRHRPARGEPEAVPADPAECLLQALGALRRGEAFVLLSFAPETPAVARAFERLRRHVRDVLGNATLVGVGPRYLHSTGQLFKGGPDRIVALVLHAPSGGDLPIPGTDHTFGELLRAQACGDFQAMKSLGRRAFWLELDSPGLLTDIARVTAPAARRAAEQRARPA